MNYAGFWRRFAAFLIDCLFIWLICLLLIIPYFIPPISLIIAIFYHVVFETSSLKATPGKALLQIAVIKSNGNTLSTLDSIIRFAVSFLSSALLCVGYLISLFTEKKQTLHDFVADTVVINGTFSENNFWDIFVSQSKIIFSNKAFIQNEKTISAQTLEELYNLYQKGAITESEYQAKKEEYLKKI